MWIVIQLHGVKRNQSKHIIIIKYQPSSVLSNQSPSEWIFRYTWSLLYSRRLSRRHQHSLCHYSLVFQACAETHTRSYPKYCIANILGVWRFCKEREIQKFPHIKWWTLNKDPSKGEFIYLMCVVLLFFINYLRFNYLRLIYVTFDRNFYYS